MPWWLQKSVLMIISKTVQKKDCWLPTKCVYSMFQECCQLITLSFAVGKWQFGNCWPVVSHYNLTTWPSKGYLLVAKTILPITLYGASCALIKTRTLLQTKGMKKQPFFRFNLELPSFQNCISPGQLSNWVSSVHNYRLTSDQSLHPQTAWLGHFPGDVSIITWLTNYMASIKK